MKVHRTILQKRCYSGIIYCWNFDLKHLSIKFVKIDWTMNFKQVYANKEVDPKVVLERLSASSLNIHERVHISDHQRFDNFKTMNDHRVLEWVWIKSPVINQWVSGSEINFFLPFQSFFLCFSLLARFEKLEIELTSAKYSKNILYLAAVLVLGAF